MIRIYCHSVREEMRNSKGFICVIGQWYWAHRYSVNGWIWYDIKECNDRFSTTLLCFRGSSFSGWFLTVGEYRDRELNKIFDDAV